MSDLNRRKAKMEVVGRNAHHHSGNNKEELKKSDKCGCFYCMRIYKASQIKDWTDGGETALCPYCMVDSVIADASGYEITKDRLSDLHTMFFEVV